MDRRQFLATLGSATAASSAGCLGVLGGESQIQQARDPWSNERRSSSLGTATVTVDVEVPADKFAVWMFNPSRATEIGYTLTLDGGGSAEVFVLDDSEFDRYRDGKSASFYQSFHGAGSLPSGSGRLGGGQYQLVVDNTVWGDVQPAGSISGTLEMEASVALF